MAATVRACSTDLLPVVPPLHETRMLSFLKGTKVLNVDGIDRFAIKSDPVSRSTTKVSDHRFCVCAGRADIMKRESFERLTTSMGSESFSRSAPEKTYNESAIYTRNWAECLTYQCYVDRACSAHPLAISVCSRLRRTSIVTFRSAVQCARSRPVKWREPW